MQYTYYLKRHAATFETRIAGLQLVSVPLKAELPTNQNDICFKQKACFPTTKNFHQNNLRTQCEKVFSQI